MPNTNYIAPFGEQNVFRTVSIAFSPYLPFTQAYAMRLKEESEDLNGSGPDALIAVFEQLPFFCCFGNIFDRDCQEDIEKYLYCNETSTPAYPGTYRDTPKIWIKKYYIIKMALALREKLSREKLQEAKNGSK